MPAQQGLPPRIYAPIAIAIVAVFLAAMVWLLRAGFATGGSVFGSGSAPAAAPSAAPAVNVEGGPPPAVRAQLQELRNRISRAPTDDVALTQLGDLYLTVGKYSEAIPYYRRALRANPNNAAAREGLSQAQAERGGTK